MPGRCLVARCPFLLRQHSRSKWCLVGAWSCPLQQSRHFAFRKVRIPGHMLGPFRDHFRATFGTLSRHHAFSFHPRCKWIPGNTRRGVPSPRCHSRINKLYYIRRSLAGGEGLKQPVCTVVLAAGDGRRATDDGRRTERRKTQETRVLRIRSREGSTIAARSEVLIHPTRPRSILAAS